MTTTRILPSIEIVRRDESSVEFQWKTKNSTLLASPASSSVGSIVVAVDKNGFRIHNASLQQLCSMVVDVKVRSEYCRRAPREDSWPSGDAAAGSLTVEAGFMLFSFCFYYLVLDLDYLCHQSRLYHLYLV